MSVKKILALVLTFTMLITLVVGCGKKETVEKDNTVLTSSEEVKYYNPLTGLSGLDAAAVNKRPVAIMINNIKQAQRVQTGLNSADIIYEAYAEGGITRLLAVFKDISKVGQIGTVRSARYSYVDLALGHDAIFTHAGLDQTKCKAHMKETGIDNMNLLSGGPSKYAFREKNGLASEHTLYTTGAKLAESHKALNWRTELKSESVNWQNFLPEGESATLQGGSCIEVKVTMSTNYITKFKYDATTKRYLRFSGNDARNDYKTGKQVSVKNVLVLKTDVTSLDSKNYLKKTGLVGGEGFYISEGNYVKVKWSKGAATNPLKITLEDGTACPYNAGNTWVCLVDKKNSTKITGEPVVSSEVAQ